MPLSVQHFFDSATSTFSYVVDDGAGHCAVIDPVMGFDQKAGRTDPGPAEAVAAHIAAKGLRVDWLLETHAHADHLSAAPWLQKRFGGLVGIGAGITQVQREFRGIFNATDLPTDGSQFGHLFADGETFSIGRLQAAALHVPGHTPADVAYRITDPAAGPDAVFVGDTLFMPDVGTARCDFPGGDARTLFQSVRRILALPAETLLYLCHDYPPAGRQAQCRTTVARQRASNIHVRDGIAAHDFVAMRTERDATLNLPALMLPAVQVNIRAGHMPPPEANGTAYLKIPVNLL
ncbi:MBL fold metallo-hydrolase [Paracidovorax citrulli]|uniref:MBL fold metallo-hydrolase n=1 Tax=Paracidovorax citrulli TaxID=80869 RepID=UPI0002D46959|nr:MBL fold metallo-hydrolase [Paracidovorax citrulli]QCX12503.1 putative metallo-hydrolase [Paracidovorax citrulli]UEG44516.1 MBL fold metallo-hydrolase [Paracidovorax citrulli]UMT88110.1 MBL fold metallo-hydrolase [Paracidovorax citrulli]UMT97189.1 MBL fold metallo-hydrolase [Paracidovorax citrulli]WIY32996.1 MBL fold metallo-hydrolase [Paracidovorax citrulli]